MEYYFVGLIVTVMTIYTANHEQTRKESAGNARYFLYGISGLIVFFGVVLLLSAFLEPPSDVDVPRVSLASAVLVFLVAFLLGGTSFGVIANPGARRWLQHLVGEGEYNPDSVVHTTAIVLALGYLMLVVSTFALVGGLSGLAETLETTGGVEALGVVFEAAASVLIALLGVGLAVRRSLPQVVERLGLRVPTADDFVWGVSAGVGLFVLVGFGSWLWSIVSTPESFEAQTAVAEQIFQSFDTLTLGFVLAISAAVGEEVLYRGALQPIFGIGLTSVFFATAHLQYTLTPASVLILFVGFGFGWVRLRQSTSAAVIAHFVYNFLPFLLVSMASSQAV